MARNTERPCLITLMFKWKRYYSTECVRSWITSSIIFSNDFQVSSSACSNFERCWSMKSSEKSYSSETCCPTLLTSSKSSSSLDACSAANSLLAYVARWVFVTAKIRRRTYVVCYGIRKIRKNKCSARRQVRSARLRHCARLLRFSLSSYSTSKKGGEKTVAMLAKRQRHSNTDVEMSIEQKNHSFENKRDERSSKSQ